MSGKKLEPELRFPGFEGEWKEITFIKLYSFKTTNSFSRDKLNYESGIVKNIHYGDIHTKFDSLFDIRNEIVPFINSDVDIARIPAECYLKEGDLVIADASEDYNDIGKCIEIINLNNEKVVAGLHTFLARKESDNISTGFASFLMKTNRIRLNIMKISQGTKVLSLSFKRLGEIQLLIPSIQEQQKIASFLRSVEQRIKALQKKKIALESYKKGMMQKLFSQEIRFKDEQGNNFTDWEEKKLGAHIEILTGYPFNGDDISEDKDGVPLLRGVNVGEGAIRHSKDIDRYYKGNLNSLEKYFIEVNDLVIGMDGSKVGKNSAIITSFDAKSLLIQRVARLRQKNNASIHFIYQHINSNYFRKYVDSVKTSSGIPHISTKQINEFKINFPVLKEQQKIASFLSAIDEAIEKVNLQVEKTQEFKKGLLQKMFV